MNMLQDNSVIRDLSSQGNGKERTRILLKRINRSVCGERKRQICFFYDRLPFQAHMTQSSLNGRDLTGGRGQFCLGAL